MTGPFGGMPSRTEPDGEVRGLGLVLPGGGYSPAAPLLDFASRALLQHGYAVQQVWWDASGLEGDPTEWVGAQVAAALGAEAPAPDRLLVAGKSLGTRAAPYAAEHGYDAIWLTPLLVDESCVEGIRRNPGRQLLVGGSGDRLWDGHVARGLEREGCRVTEIPGADHSLGVDGDVVRSAEIHVEVARSMASFLSALDPA